MRVILRPVKRNSWSGVIRYPGCTYYVGSYFTRTGRRYTGLDELQTEELGKALSQDLRPNSDFWTTFNVQVKENDVIIDTSSGPEEKLKYLFLRGHKNVAFGNQPKAGAEFQLIETEGEAAVENVRARVRRRAMLEFDKMTPDQMRKALRLLGFSSDNISNEVAESMLNKIVETEPDKFLNVWVDNDNKDVQYLLEEAVANNILRKNKTIYKYGTDVVGYTMEDAIDYLKNPINQDIKKAILGQLEAKGSVFTSRKAKPIIEETINKEE